MNNKINSKNWQRVRVSHKNKTLTFTNDITYKTMTECEKDIKSTQYMAINLKALNNLLSEGYSINDANTPVKVENAIVEVVEVVNPIEKVEVKQVKIDPVKLFLANPPRQKTHKPFDYSKDYERYYKTGKPRAEKALENQIAEYR